MRTVKQEYIVEYYGDSKEDVINKWNAKKFS